VWNGRFLPTLFIYLLVAGLTVSVFIWDRRERRYDILIASNQNLIVRAGVSILFIVGTILMGVGMYLVWAPAQATVITGIQGRYFLPFAFLALYPFLGGRLQSSQRWPLAFVVGVVLLAQVAMMWVSYHFLYSASLPEVWVN
jgi:uncharacterized membrane protein